ncbi:MAG: hypothetical protein KGR26_11585, partial [Cyanobacteria bacterium REEB65]|nr:hypothetical protein [Cyanobacteria bacterium REEB65]
MVSSLIDAIERKTSLGSGRYRRLIMNIEVGCRFIRCAPDVLAGYLENAAFEIEACGIDCRET